MPFTTHKRPTPNVSRGKNRLLGVVFHHTAGGCAGAVSWLTNRASGASAHVVIDRDGTRYVLAEPEAITWHAGKSCWKGVNGANSVTLGVEFVLTVPQVEADVALTSEQIASALEYLAPIAKRQGWGLDDFTHHAAICTPPGRKRDLSPKNWALVKAALDKVYD
ncbi:MAG: peptidoglycan recognition protein family protein [Bacteroidetes bacterium]|nr:peptidoglycan recognition protein family protein [Bacteroidota bacterium]